MHGNPGNCKNGGKTVEIHTSLTLLCLSFKFNDSFFTKRTKMEHIGHCTEILADQDASKEYGVNRNSILNELRYIFHG